MGSKKLMRIFNRAKVNRTDSKSSTDNRIVDTNGVVKFKRFVHTPIEFNHNGIEIKISETGQVTFNSSVEHDVESGDDVFDTITIPVSAVYKALELIEISRKVKFMTKEEIKQQYSDSEVTDKPTQ